MRSPEYVSREEFRNALEKTREEFEMALDAAVLQTCREIADDRKRITVLESFAHGVFNVLFVKFRGVRDMLDVKVRQYLPVFELQNSTESLQEEISAET